MEKTLALIALLALTACGKSTEYLAIDKPPPPPISAVYKVKCPVTVPKFTGTTTGDFMQYVAYRWQDARACAIRHNGLVDIIINREKEDAATIKSNNNLPKTNTGS